MWSILKTVGSYLNFPETVSASESDKYINDILEEEDDENDLGNDLCSICQHMSGTVTHLYEDHGLIDGKLYFELNNIPNGLQVGNCVSFIAFKMAAIEEWRVKNIYSIENEFWEENGGEKETVVKKKYANLHSSNISGVNLTQSQTPMFRTHIGQVVQRYGRDIVISPGDLRCNLDVINADFLPLKGDYIQMDVVYTTDGINETIIKLDNLKPLRSKPYLGQVTHWEPLHQVGIISNEIFFSKDVCEPGFIPITGDEIVADVIESEQGGVVWRALQVLPASLETQKLPSAPRNKSDLNQLLQNKQGIFIREVTDVGQVKLGQEKNLQIEVENSGSNIHILTSCAFCFKNSTPQFVLLHPLVTDKPLAINPKTNVMFTFKAKARFVGKSDEIFVWTFEGFSIGRQLKIEVQDPKTEKIMHLTSNGRPKSKNNRHSVTAKQLMATRNGFIVPGVRPIKPPSFVPVSLGMFKVPEKLINAVLGAGNKQRHEIEIRTYLCQGYPCLEGSLTPEVYRDRWHTLLYLEEIQNMIDTSMYDVQHATFTRTQGGYLSLEIPGLAEKRPSLVIGDKVVVRKAWDNTNWQKFYTILKSNEQSTMYEGYIHRVLNEEILIKFGPSFHDSYSGDYSVNFHSGRMNFRRFHQAINVAISHLDWSWLFPSSVTYQSPQVVVEEDVVDDSPETLSIDDKASEVESLKDNVINGSLKNLSINDIHINGENKSDPYDEQQCLDSEQCSFSDTTCSSEISLQSDSCNSYSTEFSNQNYLEKNPTTSDQLRSDNRIKINNLYTNNVNSGVDSFNVPTKSKRNNKININEDKHIPNGKTNTLNQTQELNSDLVHLKPSETQQRIKWNSTSKLKMGKQEISGIFFPLHFKKKIRWFNKRLNHRQKQAVKYILTGEARPLPYVIFGPPGTGKTITLVEAALQILSLLTDSRLLIATPSNSAANLVAERLLESGVFSPGMLLRLVSRHYAEDGRLPLHLMPVCGVPEMKQRDSCEPQITTFNGTPIKSLYREDIGRQRVTIGTCTALGVLYNMGFPKGHFTHILIDEAGQATEPEVLIPLAFLHMEKGQTILAGDPLQLGPVVTSSLAGDLGLSESLLARLLRRSLYCRDMIGFPETGGYNPCLITRLVNNYRSLPEILNLPSMMFYDGDLVPLVSEINSEEAEILCKLNEYLNLPPREGSTLPPAIVFHGVRGSNTQSPESPSWYNPQEAVQAGHYLEQAYECGLTVDQIGVVTPYQKQASKIRETLEASELPIPKVGSVEEFQGQERMMMILSTVRSNMKLIQNDVTHSLGFVASPRRLNVALTRGRALLIIIGDPHLLSFDNYWRTVLTYCVKRNAYIGCDLPLSLAE